MSTTKLMIINEFCRLESGFRKQQNITNVWPKIRRRARRQCRTAEIVITREDACLPHKHKRPDRASSRLRLHGWNNNGTG